MQRCFSTLGCPDLSLADVRALAARFHLDGVELRALHGATDLAAIFREHFGRPAELARYLAADALPGIVVIDTSLKLATAADWAGLRELVPWAEAVGVRWLRVFDGGKAGVAPDLAAAVEGWHRWRGERARAGWSCDLIVETHDSLLSGAAIAEFLQGAPEAGILWDSHHTWRLGGEAPEVTWPAIAGAVRHVHVKDSRTAADGGFGYVAPGTGEYPMRALRRILHTAGFAGAISLEWERLWIPALAPLETALRSAEALAWW